MKICRHDQSIQPNDVIQAVAVSRILTNQACGGIVMGGFESCAEKF